MFTSRFEHALVSGVDRWRALPWWARALAIYAGVRVLMLPAYVVAWSQQGPNNSFYSDHPPDFGEFLGLSWDGGWYREIAEHGYPSDLPVQPDGTVIQNAWAFYPVFPMITRVVMATGLPWTVAGPVVSMLMGALAMVLLSALVRSAAPEAVEARPGLPDLTVAAMSAFPGAAVFGVAYSESTALVFVVASLLLIHRHRYGWAMLTVTALGFSRAAALPMIAVVVWHAACRWREDRRRGIAWSSGIVGQLGGLAGVTVLAGFAWPWLTGVVTGRGDAYFATQNAWRDGADSQRPFAVFATRLSEWVGDLALPLTLLACVVIAVLSLTGAARRLGPELQAWGGAYLIFLLAAAALSSSGPRFVLLSITVPMAFVAWPRRRATQAVLLAVLLASQVLWIVEVWVFSAGGDAWPP